MEAEQIKFNLKDEEDKEKIHEVEVLIYNLTDEQERNKGFNTVKQQQLLQHSHIRIIVGGGDGTVPWVIHNMVMYQVEVDKVPLGIIPFGTGNDFSRVLGWGGEVPDELVGKKMNILKAMIR